MRILKSPLIIDFTEYTTPMSLKKKFAHFIAKNSYRRPIDRLCALCNYYRESFANLNYDWRTNGESRVLDILAKSLEGTNTPTIFDVGANIGDWSNIAAQVFPQSNIYSFEPIPKTFARFKENTQSQTNIHAFNVGLSDKDEELTFAYNADNDAYSSALIDAFEDGHHYIDHSFDKGKLTTGDSFCQENNINNIDFLKIDTEGYEGHVLRGFEHMLSSGKIHVIQFEYNRACIFANFILKNFYDLLKEQYALGKIYPNRVRFKDYSSEDEDFMGPNYLAVLKTEHDLINKLSKIDG